MRRTKPLVERNPRSLRPTTVFLDSFTHDHDSDLKFWEDFLQRVIPGHSGATMLPRSEARTACFSSAHAGELIELLIPALREYGVTPLFKFIEGALTAVFTAPVYSVTRISIHRHVRALGCSEDHASVVIVY